MRRQRPDSKLADAQHAIAAEYGFTNWPALRAHVDAAVADRPFVGTWRLNPSTSRPVTAGDVPRLTLRIAVAGDTVTITDVVVDASGREERGVNTIRADGEERTFEYGYAVMAQWRGARVLETMVKKDGRQVSRLTYELSADGKSLTVAGSAAAHDGYPAVDRFSVFDRVSGDADTQQEAP